MGEQVLSSSKRSIFKKQFKKTPRLATEMRFLSIGLVSTAWACQMTDTARQYMTKGWTCAMCTKSYSSDKGGRVPWICLGPLLPHQSQRTMHTSIMGLIKEHKW